MAARLLQRPLPGGPQHFARCILLARRERGHDCTEFGGGHFANLFVAGGGFASGRPDLPDMLHGLLVETSLRR